MAGINVYATSGEITLGNSGGWKTLLMFVEAANSRSRIRSWGVYPMGTVNSDPHIRTRLIKASSQGTGGGSVTAQVTNGVAEAVRGTFKDATTTFSVEPAPTGQPLDKKSAHPQGGTEWPSVDPEERFVAGGEIFIIQYWNDAGPSNLKATADLGLEQ